MKIIKQLLIIIIIIITSKSNTFGQANPFINVLPSNSGIVTTGGTIDIIVTIGNSGPISAVPQAKLRPIIQVPPSVTFLPNAQQLGLPAGWTILSNTGSQLRVCNSTDPIPVSTSRTIYSKGTRCYSYTCSNFFRKYKLWKWYYLCSRNFGSR